MEVCHGTATRLGNRNTVTDLHEVGMARIRGKSTGMGAIVAGIPQGWNLLLWKICRVCLENVQPCDF